MLPGKRIAMENENNDRREIEKARFRIDTTVNLAHILTTVALVVSIISWGSDLKSTVLKHEGDIVEIKASMRDDRQFLREELRDINRKIDKLVDGKANR
jgi:hypothetical protein